MRQQRSKRFAAARDRGLRVGDVVPPGVALRPLPPGYVSARGYVGSAPPPPGDLYPPYPEIPDGPE